MRARGDVALTDEERRASRNLHLLMRIFDLTDREVGERVGLSHQAIQQRRYGTTRIRLGDDRKLADAMGVPVELLHLEPPAILRWIADHRPDLLERASGWIHAA